MGKKTPSEGAHEECVSWRYRCLEVSPLAAAAAPTGPEGAPSAAAAPTGPTVKEPATAATTTAAREATTEAPALGLGGAPRQPGPPQRVKHHLARVHRQGRLKGCGVHAGLVPLQHQL